MKIQELSKDEVYCSAFFFISRKKVRRILLRQSHNLRFIPIKQLTLSPVKSLSFVYAVNLGKDVKFTKNAFLKIGHIGFWISNVRNKGASFLNPRKIQCWEGQNTFEIQYHTKELYSFLE